MSGGVLGFVLRRLGQGALVLLAVSMLAFLAVDLAGDPVGAVAGVEASAERRAEIARALGLDRPLPLRWASFVGGALEGDFGTSWRTGTPALPTVLSRAQASAELALASAVPALVLGAAAGAWAAARPRSAAARGLAAASLLGAGVPVFVIGLTLIQVFAVDLGWLPAAGRPGTVAIGAWRTSFLTPEGRAGLVLPALTLALFQAPAILRIVRAETAAALAAEPARAGRARGLPEGLLLRHALRAAAPAVIAAMATSLGGIVAFATVTETVFQWPGAGLLFLQSVEAVDAPVIAACLCLAAAVFVALNLAADLAHLALDPRLRG